ncbi:MAG: acyl-CoA dehydrogenase family protein [Deinococcales bacterium]
MGPYTQEMDFSLSDHLLSMRQMVRDFAQSEIAPIAAELDKNPRFPRESLKKMAALGLLGVMTPEAYGGAGLDHLSYAVLVEEIAAADAAHATLMSVTNGFPQQLLLAYGSEAQKDRYLRPLAKGDYIGGFCLSEPHCGSDAVAMTTKALKTEGGYILQGQKAWITAGGEAEVYLVLAKTKPEAGARGVSCFIVEKSNPGISFGKPEEKLGQHASVTTTVSFEDCFVPDEALIGQEGQGFVMAMGLLDGGRIGIAALAVGVARAAFEAARNYANERQAFGQSLRHFQGISFKLADMATRLEAARLLTHKAAWLKDKGRQVSQEASMAKLFASEMSSFVTHQALQIFGGYGYTKDYPVEKYFRDARVTEIYEGTSEIQRMVISRQLYQQD